MASQGMFKTGNENWTARMLAPSDPLVAGVTTDLAVSDEVANQGADEGIIVNVEYGAPTPDGKDGGTSFYLWTVLEAKDPDGNWYVLGSTNAEYYHSEINPKRRIVVDPRLTVSFPGVDDQVWLGRAEMLISNWQGRLPASSFRIKILVQDNDPDGVKKFVSVPVTASWEKYSV